MAVLETPIASDTSVAGQPIALRLLGPLRSTDPRRSIPDGARVRGVIAGVTSGYLPIIQLRFTSVDTDGGGTATIHTKVRYAGSAAWVDPHALYDPESLGYDTILYDVQFRPSREAGTAIGGGPPALDDPVTPMRFPAGTEFELILARPLALTSP